MKKISRLSSIVLWSVISAAFIGPGTITTAVKAGSEFGIELLWVVVFATLACIVIQEMAARVVISSGKNLGQVMTMSLGAKYGGVLQFAIGGIVVIGCGAYEAGNILGAVAGLELLTGVSSQLLTVFISIASFVVLWFGRPSWISGLMLLLVAVMGIGFFTIALAQPVTAGEITGALVPTIPSGSGLIIVGLVGTTIVPYNIFLGSGISHGQTVRDMRLGLTVSVVLGGMVTAAILIAGLAVGRFDSFEDLAKSFHYYAGGIGTTALALGLFAAGFSSSVTAPFASAIIAESVFNANKKMVRLTWIIVLLCGFVFGLKGIKPIPVILAVQALNGLILPLLILVLIFVINDPDVVSTQHRHRSWYNLVLLLVLAIVLVIGLNNVMSVVSRIFSLSGDHLIPNIFISVSISLLVGWRLGRGV